MCFVICNYFRIFELCIILFTLSPPLRRTIQMWNPEVILIYASEWRGPELFADDKLKNEIKEQNAMIHALGRNGFVSNATAPSTTKTRKRSLFF